MGYSRPLYSLFCLFNSKQENLLILKFCQWLDSSLGPLALEVISLSTDPQQFPLIKHFAIVRLFNIYEKISIETFCKFE